ncbi:hypothetical protein M513_00670 [Trichuris suis]|uniref:Uncharacterized protein n=1 Tax=Trichuris suis TaxID=68888 RepID=A0A085MMJ8_9BILA|nr:hypothetical protein M513_00670 [Trichuris suis]
MVLSASTKGGPITTGRGIVSSSRRLVLISLACSTAIHYEGRKVASTKSLKVCKQEEAAKDKEIFDEADRCDLPGRSDIKGQTTENQKSASEVQPEKSGISIEMKKIKREMTFGKEGNEKAGVSLEIERIRKEKEIGDTDSKTAGRGTECPAKS